jgi:hypothetical protein
MVKAIRKPNWFYWLVSWFSSGYILFALEYYLGLELLRPFLIWILVSSKELSPREKWRQTLIHWSPYLVLLGAYGLWRFFLLPPSRYGVGMKDYFLNEPLGTLLSLAQTITKDLVQVSLLVWEKVVRLIYLFTETGGSAWIYRLVILGVSLFLFIIFRKRMQELEQDPDPWKTGKGNWIQQPVFLGAVFMIFAGLPYWSVPLKMTLDFASNRHTIPMTIGASIFLVGLVDMVTRSDRNARIIMALLAGFASGYHYQNARSFSTEWSLQKDFIWQFLWRVPYLEPGTIILGDDFPFPYSDDEAVTSMINLAYRQVASTTELPYAFFFVGDALGNEIQNLDPGIEVVKGYGALHFSGSTSQMIAVSYSGNDCMRILTPTDDDLGQVYPGLLSEVVHLTNTTHILEKDDTYDLSTLERIFGQEPAHTWCYYYQKAELARQSKQWDRVVKIGQQVDKRGFKSYAPEELFPFIEGYTNVGDLDKAKQLTFEAIESTRTLRPVLCAIWERIPYAVFAEGADPAIQLEVLNKLECVGLE